MSKLAPFSILLVISGSLKGSLLLLHRLKHLNPTSLHLVASLSNLCHPLYRPWAVLM